MITEEKIEDACKSIEKLAAAITPNIAGTTGPGGIHVESLTEAIMDHNATQNNIAMALNRIADAIELLSMKEGTEQCR